MTFRSIQFTGHNIEALRAWGAPIKESASSGVKLVLFVGGKRWMFLHENHWVIEVRPGIYDIVSPEVMGLFGELNTAVEVLTARLEEEELRQLGEVSVVLEGGFLVVLLAPYLVNTSAPIERVQFQSELQRGKRVNVHFTDGRTISTKVVHVQQDGRPL